VKIAFMFLSRRIRFFNGCLFATLLGLMLLASCSSSRFVPQGKYLLNRIDVKVDDKNLKKQNLRSYIKQKENLRILGFLKFYLGLYNLSSAKKQNDWLKRIGEAPVLYDVYQTQKSKEQLEIFLKNKGYYNAVVKDTTEIDPKKRKLNLVFRVQAGKPYRIRKYIYSIRDKAVRETILKDTTDQLIKTNQIFDLDVLNAERQRLVSYLKNRGYYTFVEDFISFRADTSFNNNRVDLTVKIDDKPASDDSVSFRLRKYKIRNYVIDPDVKTVDFTQAGPAEKVDTLRQGNYLFLYSGRLAYKPGLFYNLNRMKDSTYFCQQNVEKTYQALNRLRQFKLININFDETSTFDEDSVSLLDCKMLLSPLPKQNISVDIEGTNSSGNLGVAGNLNYQQRNIFGGAEVFDIQLRGARERQQAMISNNSLNFNTKEFGVESSLTIPKFLSPFLAHRWFSFQIPQTKFTVGFNYQRRPDYTRTITNLKFGYNWKTSNFELHTFNPIDFNYVVLYSFNPDFMNKIQDLYIKSSFTDHLIVASNYSWIYNTQNPDKREDYQYYRVNLESAGNLLSLYSRIINKRKTLATDTLTGQLSSYYEVLNTRFAQYVKGDFEYRFGHVIDDKSSLVARAFLGVGVPYGNFDVLPFEKKYFTGGANGIRAWQVRSLGPGSYQAPANSYPNQSGDIKIEANLEYRFKLFWLMEAALFTDAGNIWAINYRDNRPGALFKFDGFYQQIAVGSGAGLRFDFTYFLFRLDLGMKMRDPSLPAGRRFIPGSYRIKADDFNLSFAIGYPF
jgi:outer membrane protein assembly factor BamA